MLSDKFIEEIVDKYEIVLNDGEWEELEEDGNHYDTNNHYATDVSPASVIESLGENGFSENDVEQLFKGNYILDSGMWGKIPHEVLLYTTERKDFYILTLEAK